MGVKNTIRSLTIIIPCYNESATIGKVIKGIENLSLTVNKEIIVVDDGSTDGSSKIIRHLSRTYPKMICIFCETNRGKGAAIKAALKIAAGDYVVIQDADLECKFTDINKLLKFAEKNHLKAVFGSRNLQNGKHLYKHYYLGGVFLTWLINRLFNQRLSDAAVAYKLIERKILNRLEIQSDGFGVCVEITAKLAIHGIEIGEIPIFYKPRSFRDGKKLRALDGMRGFLLILKLFTKDRLEMFVKALRNYFGSWELMRRSQTPIGRG